MMLTPEQLAEIRHLLQEDGNRHDGAIVTYPRSLYTMRDMLAHIEAQQARIAELEAKIGAGNEWRRAHDDLLASPNKARGRITELEQDAARYRWLKKYDKDNQCCFVSNIQYKEYDQEIDEAMQK